jgi:hypothetical protein
VAFGAGTVIAGVAGGVSDPLALPLQPAVMSEPAMTKINWHFNMHPSLLAPLNFLADLLVCSRSTFVPSESDFRPSSL